MAARQGDRSRPLDPARVRAFQRRVAERVERELAGGEVAPGGG